MAGASPGNPEDLLGQFLAHRAGPSKSTNGATPTRAPESGSPEDQPQEPGEADAAASADAAGSEATAPSPDETDDESTDESTTDESTDDESTEEPVGAPVYEMADAPLDFPESEPAVADTLAHAGAVLEAFAAGTLDIEPDAAVDDGEGDGEGEVDRGAEPMPAPLRSAGADDASRAVLAAFLGTTQPQPEPEATLEPEAEPEPPAAAPDEVAAFEQLAVSSPLTRERPATPGHRGTARADEVDDRPDATAASATVFAAFQEQLARQDAAPAATPPREPAAPAPGAVRQPEKAPAPEPVPVPEPEVLVPIAPPTTRAQAPLPARRRAGEAEAKVTAPRLPATPAPAAEPARPAVPNEVVFKPRRMARALVALILVVFVATSALACWWAYQDRTLVPVGIAATVLIATGIVWATRAGSTVAHLSVRGGRLEITKDGTRTVFDLSSHYTDIQVHGTPGRRNWRVMFGRRGLPPYVIDASMVSPAEFMRVLEHYRPGGHPPAEG